MATDQPGRDLTVLLTPRADRYDLDVTATGDDVQSITAHYAMADSGHWYGHGEATTDRNGPYEDQPWPLDDQSDSGTVTDDAFGPAAYEMVEPFWFTQAASGIVIDTAHLMKVSLGGRAAGIADFTVQDSSSLHHTVFVERTPREVYQDYIGITGNQRRATPRTTSTRRRCGTRGRSSTPMSPSRSSSLGTRHPRRRHPRHTRSDLDDRWMSHYGDLTFNDKFPDPKAMSDAVHALGSASASG